MANPKSLNKAALINLYNIGGKELVLRMMDRFIQSTPERLETARLRAGEKDLRSLHLIAHSLKATAANIGSDRFRDLAEQLEEIATSDQPNGVDHVLAELTAMFKEAEVELRNERASWQPAS
jgi:HPt (histidine-containing phosphotransfer) domain-containing protein